MVGCFSYLHSQCTVREAYWLQELDCHWKNRIMKNALALASGDLDSDPRSTAYWVVFLFKSSRQSELRFS